MEKLQNSALFTGMTEAQITGALKAMEARVRSYERGALLLCAGDATDRMGMVESGSVTIERVDAWGGRTILSHVGTGGLFAEAYAALPNEPLLVDVVANEPCRVLLLRMGALDWRSLDEPWVAPLLSNLVRIASRKNLSLSARSFHTAPKTVRGRVMAYLDSLSLAEHSDALTVPFDRQQLADYLNVDRTALSKELGKMRREGLIEVKGRRFRIIARNA